MGLILFETVGHFVSASHRSIWHFCRILFNESRKIDNSWWNYTRCHVHWVDSHQYSSAITAMAMRKMKFIGHLTKNSMNLKCELKLHVIYLQPNMYFYYHNRDKLFEMVECCFVGINHQMVQWQLWCTICEMKPHKAKPLKW